jgi:hypothetical protein
MPIITLTTDFGLDDCYVGVMKGVILSRNPAAQIIDLCHAIGPQDILQAAYLVQANFSYFPEGTLHLIIVDPGVGSDRKIILARACNHLFLAPDNGVLSPFLHKGQITSAFSVDREDLYLYPVSRTFHGRDIFAPLAAHLTSGGPPESIGPKYAIAKLRTINPPLPVIDKTNATITGTIIHIDRFGNSTTNITLNEIRILDSPPESLALTLKSQTITGLQTNYTAAAPGKPLLTINSQNFLEIAVNQGNAQALLNLSLYDTVLLRSTC